MTVNIIIIGDEILLGRITDTNSGAISRALDPLGFRTGRILTIGDDGEEIRRAVEASLAEADLTITTGGLGPTKDDITKHTLLEVFGGEMRMDPEVTANIHEIFDRKGLRMNALTDGQALVPTSCRVIQNRLGTAPIMWFERDGRVLISMPGVPFETEGMLKMSVVGEIAAHFCSDSAITHRTCVVNGISESALAEKLADFEDSLAENFHLAYLPDSPLITLRLDAKGNDRKTLEAEADRVFGELRDCLGGLMLCDHAATAAEILLERLRARGLTFTSAESCTGGNIAHSVTMIAGCSDVMMGGVVSYANEVKINILGVTPETLDAHGAVSEEVVRQMVAGAMRATGATTAVATSGIAGPGGGSEEKPVGTVWIATATPEGIEANCYRFPGDRARVITRATTTALLDLVKRL